MKLVYNKFELTIFKSYNLFSELAGDWLQAIPCKSLGLHLRRTEFVLAGRYRLGMPVFSSGIGGERIARHNHVMDAIYQVAVQAGLDPRREI